MDRERTHTATQIALDVGRDRDRELLAKLFADSDVREFSGPVPDGTDLCIVDERALERSADRFEAWHTRQSPSFAPVVLLSDADASTFRGGFEGLLGGPVDAVFRIPLPKAELSARVDNLLQMREFSRDLAAEKQFTDTVFEASPLAKLVLDPDGTVLRANQRAEDLFDVAQRTLVGRKYSDGDWRAERGDGSAIPDDELPFARVLESGEPVYEYEHVISRPGYDDKWVSVNMAPIRDESGQLMHVVVVIEDVTVRHAQARELERQVDLFRKAQAIANVGAWEYDVRGDRFYWSDEVYNIHGLPTDVSLTVEEVFEVFHPEDQPVIRDAFERAIVDGEPYELELRLVREDGDQRWVNMRGEPQLADGDVVRLRGTIQDVTERKEREEQLQRMRNAVDTAPIGITLSDPAQEDNPIIYVNEGFVEITGYTREESLGRNCRFLQGADTDEETVARLRRKIDANEPVSETIRNYRADGSAFWNQLQIAPVRDDEGRVVNYIGFQQDVTESVERQRQLEILDRYLRHNIRNKMTVVNGLAESIKAEGGQPVTDYAASIERAGETLMKNMEKEREITTLLGADPAPKRIELPPLIQSVVTDCTTRYPDATVTHSGPESVAIEALPELSMAFEELVANAVEHSDRMSPTVEIAVEPAGDTVCIHVVDDGPGVPEEEVDVLSNPDTETTVHHGRGMGLWLVQLVVNRSGGTLEFDQRDSGDNVVTVEVPRSKASGETE